MKTLKKHKVIHLITRLDKGGSAENTFLSAREFIKKGYEVEVWSGTHFDLPRETKKEAEAEGIPVEFIPSLVRSIHPFKDLAALFVLTRKLKKEKPDILHTHTSKAGFIGRLAGKLAGIPVIIHTPHGHVFYSYFSRVKTKIFILLERWAARWTDVIIPLTQKGVQEHLKQGIGRAEQYVQVVSGVDWDLLQDSNQLRHEGRRKLGIKDETVVIGFVGRFARVKGLDLLIEAAPHLILKFPDSLFYFAGMGPLKEDYERRVKELKIQDHVVFDEFQDVNKPLNIIDIFVLPSRNEGQSRTLIEAMYLKKTVVGSSAGGIPDVIQNGETGLVFQTGNPSDLADKLTEVLGHPEKRASMAEKAKKRAEDRFSLEKMIADLEEIYLKLLKQKEKSTPAQ